MLDRVPFIDYKFDSKTIKRIQNFVVGVKVEDKNLRNRYLFKPYILKEGDTPENVSHALYGTPDYWWVILLVNNYVNPFDDWIKTTDQMSLEKASYPNDILFFKDIRTGRIVDDVDHDIFMGYVKNKKILPNYINAIHRFDFEKERNDAISLIWILDEEYILSFVDEYEYLLSGNFED